MSEKKFAKRVSLSSFEIAEYADDDGDIVFLSIQEHEHLVKQAVAAAWEEAGRTAKLYSPGDLLYTVFETKAKWVRDGR